MKKLYRLFILSLLLLLKVTTESCAQADHSLASQEGLPAPAFSLKDTEVNTFHSTDYEGNYVVIHIATTWCPYCNAEAPYLQELSQQYRDKNVKVLIIDVKEEQALVQERIKDRFNLSFPVLLDTDGQVAACFAPEDILPELARDEIMLASNLLLDPEGNIQFFSLLDSKNFDAKLLHLTAKLDALLQAQ